jgi:hypothetical protein
MCKYVSTYSKYVNFSRQVVRTIGKHMLSTANESRATTGCGATLWIQRKIQAAGFDKKQAMKLGLDIRNQHFVKEDTASGDSVVVTDIDGLGRCITLTCQDIMANPLSEALIRQFQPDWVFVPVLDSNLRIGRWAHQRAFSLSRESRARFVIAKSLVMAKKLCEKIPHTFVEPSASKRKAWGPTALRLEDRGPVPTQATISFSQTIPS